MKKSFDFSKEWAKTKKQLESLSKETIILAKKGEEELVKFSKKGKLHLDSTAISLKIERLYYMIGKEYVKTKSSNRSSAKLESLISQINKLGSDQRILQRKIRQSPPKSKKAAKQR